MDITELVRCSAANIITRVFQGKEHSTKLRNQATPVDVSSEVSHIGGFLVPSIYHLRHTKKRSLHFSHYGAAAVDIFRWFINVALLCSSSSQVRRR
jgi:hypothetical protein